MPNGAVCKEEFDSLPNDEGELLYGLGSPGFGASVDNEVGVFVAVADVLRMPDELGGDGHIGPGGDNNITTATYQDHLVLILAPVMRLELIKKLAFDKDIPGDKRFDINDFQTPNPAQLLFRVHSLKR